MQNGGSSSLSSMATSAVMSEPNNNTNGVADTPSGVVDAVPPIPARTGIQDPGLVGPASALPSQMGMMSSYAGGTGVGGGVGGFGGYGGYGGYGNTYGGSYGGYGGYGNSFNSYGGGYNRYGNNYMGGNQLQASTAATFQMIESIVGAFGGFAQMLESTYMATHSSFFAMVSVAEQLGHLKESLGSILGIFAIIRWGKAILRKLKGGKSPVGKNGSQLSLSEFQKFQSKAGVGSHSGPTPSVKPLLLFLAAVFGLPWLIGRFVRALNQQAIADQQQYLPGPTSADMGPIDVNKLQFCRALYEFIPENPAIELELKKGDLLAILTNTDSFGKASQWWRVRARDGRSGYIPATYVEILPQQLPSPAAQIESKPSKVIEAI